METTIFTKVIDNETLFVFEFYGNRKTPYEQGSQRKRVGLLTKDGFAEQNYNTPAGAYTRIESLDFEEAMRLSLENTKRLEKEHAEKAAIEKAEKEEKRKARFNAKMEEAMSTGKGWYSVNVSALVMKHRGNDGWIDQSVRVLAANGYDAYNKAVDFIQNPENFQRNTMLVQFVEEFETAFIEYIGVLTDEYLLENE